MTPTIGRVVHFVYGTVHFAATITAVQSDVLVNLFVLPNGVDELPPATTGPDVTASVPRVITRVGRADVNALGEAPGYSWHWPEREADA